MNDAAQVVPEAQSQSRVLLSVRPDEVSRKLVHLTLGIQAHALGCFGQRPLALGFLEVVPAKRIERIAEAVLIDQRRRDHGVHDLAGHFDPFAAQPTHVVHRIVKDVRGIRLVADILQPTQGRLGIEVRTVLMADREVPSLTWNRDSHANDVSLLGCPAGSRFFQMRVVGFKIDCYLRNPRQIRELLRHHPLRLVFVLKRHPR